LQKFNCFRAFEIAKVLAGAIGRENRLVHISDDSDRSERDHGCLRFTDRIKFPVLEIRHHFISPFINSSFHHLHRITPINAISLLC
jgi:hypothetical protein